MSLFNLLSDRQDEVLIKCRSKMQEVSGSLISTSALDKGLPVLYGELLEVLRVSQDGDSSQERSQYVSDKVTVTGSRQHAQESYRLGYTVSQVVHFYGSICQGITEFAHEANARVTTAEFAQLNLSLDYAVAQAVNEYELLTLEKAGSEETMRLGFLAHELRNALANAIMAFELIRSGGVGTGGATGTVLINAHHQMKDLIDRAMVSVRLAGRAVLDVSRIQVLALISEIEASALPEANAKSLRIVVEADPGLTIQADRHLMASAIANLVQNAIKFTHDRGTIWIRAHAEGAEAIIEVEDRCGGLPDGLTEELFKPYAQMDSNKSGLGLGLSIARRAIQQNGGTLSARDLPGIGCVFTVRMPLSEHAPKILNDIRPLI